MMLDVIGWIIGAALMAWGVTGLVFIGWFVEANKSLTRTEIGLMKKGGLFPGESEYMRDFRVAQSEWDLQDDAGMLWRSGLLRYGVPLVIGLALLGVLTWRAWF